MDFFSDWFSFERVSVEDDHFRYLKFEECTLLKDFVQFPKGTRFTSLRISPHLEIRLHIFEEGKKNNGAEDGYYYHGKMRMAFFNKDNVFDSIESFCSSKYKICVSKKYNHFEIENAVSNTDLFPNRRPLGNVIFDIIQGKLVAAGNNNKLYVQFILGVNFIASRYLQEEYEKKHISFAALDTAKSFREKFNIDVDLPHKENPRKGIIKMCITRALEQFKKE